MRLVEKTRSLNRKISLSAFIVILLFIKFPNLEPSLPRLVSAVKLKIEGKFGDFIFSNFALASH